jgi:hypothetical protein
MLCLTILPPNILNVSRQRTVISLADTLLQRLTINNRWSIRLDARWPAPAHAGTAHASAACPSSRAKRATNAADFLRADWFSTQKRKGKSGWFMGPPSMWKVPNTWPLINVISWTKLKSEQNQSPIIG